MRHSGPQDPTTFYENRHDVKTEPSQWFSLDEMIECTHDQVKRFTENQQHSALAGQFDRSLPIGAAK